MSICRPDKRHIGRVDLINAFLSPKFFLSAAGVFLFCIVSVYQFVPIHDLGRLNTVYVVNLLLGLSVFKKIIVVFASIPFVTSFCSEWNTQYIRFLTSRSGVLRYICSKIFVCLLSSFAVVLLGLLVFVFFLSFFMPLFPQDQGANSTFPFGEFLTSGVPLACLGSIIFAFALGNSFWVACGLTLSAYLPNRYLAILSPFAFSYILEQMTLEFPPWASLYLLSRAQEVLESSPLINLFYYLLIFGLLIVVCGFIFSHRVRQRMYNEVV
jgi:hypothetical protein